MAAPASTQIPKQRNNYFSWLKTWLEPRSTNRDDAFRERTIRITVTFVVTVLLLSFAASIFVFRDKWEIISFPTVHLFALILCGLTLYSLSKRRIISAGWYLVICCVMGAASFIVLASYSASLVVVLLSIPVSIVAVVVTALVLPRSQIMLVAAGAIALNSLALLGVQAGVNALPNFDITVVIGSTVFLLLIAGTFLRQLRIEFDYRLNVMAQAIEQAELARAQAEAQRQRAELADRAKSQFLANMSHELRTPLNAIIGYDEAMLGGMAGEFTSDQKTLLGHIQFNSRRLLALIDDVLDLAKIESGSLQVFLAPLSPRKVIGDLIENMQALAQKQSIYLKVNFADDVPEVVLSDSKKLQQVISNLVGNAVKFTSQGGVTVDIDSHDANIWRIRVKDTGIGMPADAASYIFEPFRQVDGTDTRKYKGTGLGLAITKRLVDSLGGSISVETELGRGSTFTVIMPRTKLPEKADTQSALPAAVKTTA